MKIAGNKLIVECSAYDFKERLEAKEPESWLKSVSAFAESKTTAHEIRPEDKISAQINRPEGTKTAQRKIGKTAQSIIDILVSNPNATRAQLCETLGKADGTIKEHLAKLQARRIIERVGGDFGGHWKVLIRK